MRKPWKSQGAGVRAGAGLDRYRVVQHLVRYQGQDRPGLLFKEPCKSQEVGLGEGAGLE